MPRHADDNELNHDEVMHNFIHVSVRRRRRVINDLRKIQSHANRIYSSVPIESLDEGYRILMSDCDAIQNELHAEAVKAVDCTLCGNCCTAFNCGPPEEEELTAIAEYLQEPPDAVVAKWTDGGHGRCPMLGADGRCTIYEVRPEVCRRYPPTKECAVIYKGERMAYHCSVCPIVYHIGRNIVRRLKEKAAVRKG